MMAKNRRAGRSGAAAVRGIRAAAFLAAWGVSTAFSNPARAVDACDGVQMMAASAQATGMMKAGKLTEAAALFVKTRDEFYRCAEAKPRRIDPFMGPAMTTVFLNLSLVYERLGNYSEAYIAHGTLIEALKQKAPGDITPEMLERLRMLEARVKKGGAAPTSTPTTAPPPPKPTAPAPSLVDQLLAAIQMAQDGKTLQALSLVEPLMTRAEQAPEPIRTAFFAQVGAMYDDVDRYTEAEAMLLKARGYLDKNAGAELAIKLLVPTYLAQHYKSSGDNGRAVEWYRKVLPLAEQKGAAELVSALDGLAYAQANLDDHANAKASAERALELAQKTWKPDDPKMLGPLHALGWVLGKTGDYARAEVLLLQCKDLVEKTLGPKGWPWVNVLAGLGWHYRAAGDYRKSMEFYDKRFELVSKLDRPDSLAIAMAKCQMAETLWNMKDFARAIPLGMECNDIREKHLAAMLSSGSEDQRRANVKTLDHETDVTVTVGVEGAKSDKRVPRFALDTVLRRKGRVLDAMSDTMSRVRKSLSEDDRKRMDRLSNVRTLLAGAAMGGGNTEALAEEARQLEAGLARTSVDYRSQAITISTQAVQSALPEDGALVEIVSYRPYDFKAKLSESHGPPTYVAFVVRRTGEPEFAVLGKASEIDADVRALREQMAGKNDTKETARRLDSKVMAPVRAMLKGTRKVFLSPDGALNLVPFAALVDEQGHYLLESFAFTYLTSGRDLLRMGKTEGASSGIRVFANPDYRSEAGASTGAKRAMGFALRNVPPLPGTAEEAKAIALLLPETKQSLGAEATESAVKSVSRPRVLHIATHGFFLGATRAATASSRSLEYDEGPPKPAGTKQEVATQENPLLRSGLLLAGAATLHGGGMEDGILTALEASSLDLRGTGLVVLSACETGVGEVRSGEGVYGLRRAFVMAGAESLVMSLWSVDDDATRELMSRYYRRLETGQGRSEALRQSQIDMLKTPKYALPFFWAAFIPSGDPAPIDLGMPDPVKQSETPARDASSDGGGRSFAGLSMPWTWFRFDAGLGSLSMEATPVVAEESTYGARVRGEVSILGEVIPRGSFRVYDSVGGQLLYAGDGKSHKELSYDLMIGYDERSFGLLAGVRAGIGSARLGDLESSGSFVPLTASLRMSSLALQGWGGSLGGQRSSAGVVVRYKVSRKVWLDGGYQRAQGREGQSPATSVTHLGLGFSL